MYGGGWFAPRPPFSSRPVCITGCSRLCWRQCSVEGVMSPFGFSVFTDLVVSFCIASPGREKGRLQGLAYLRHLSGELRLSGLWVCASFTGTCSTNWYQGSGKVLYGPRDVKLALARGVVRTGITGFMVPRNRVLGLLSLNGGNSLAPEDL